MNNWYKAAIKGTSVEVDIYDEIGGWGVTAESFRSEVKDLLDQNKNAKTLFINIDSPGGVVFEGISIHNFIKSLDVKTVVKIDALAASIATVIALGADEVQMSSNGFFMIHNPHTIIMGEAEDLRKQADTMDKIKGVLSDIYTNKTGLSSKEVQKMMDSETWLTASEALEKGFIDVINEGVAIAANAKGSEKYKNLINQFNNIPKNLKMQENIEKVEETDEVVIEATNEVAEATEETTESSEESNEETQEEVVEEVAETSIVNKILALIGGKKEEVSNELSDRYAEVSNELKEAKAKISDYEASNKETETVLNKAHDEIVNLKSKISSLENSLKEANEKLSETEGEELKQVVTEKETVQASSLKDVFRNHLKK